MNIILDSYEILKNNEDLSSDICQKITESSSNQFQLTALATRLLYKQCVNTNEKNLLFWIFEKFPEIANLAYAKFKEHTIFQIVPNRVNPESIDFFYKSLIQNTNKERVIGEEKISILIKKIIDNSISLDFLALWLTIICKEGLSEPDTIFLTTAMIKSGEIFDYRNRTEIENRKIIRRYPTGALSEKTALILPSLIASFSSDFPIATSFVVGKSLGFTGGTWDKLNSIPGFVFPSPGDETINVLKKCSVAMCVTKNDLNPADRILYQFRSITGTIDSIELIVASIVSKQLACPPDLLLLDIRYGSGAFMKNIIEAKELEENLINVINQNNVLCISKLTSTDQPSGLAIGNTLEVSEALSIMLNKVDKSIWDQRAIDEQREIVIDFFIILMTHMFPNLDVEKLKEQAETKFLNGEIGRCFLKILNAHSVSVDLTNHLLENPDYLLKNIITIKVYSKKSGILRNIDQKKLGHFVNYSLNAGGNVFSGEQDQKSGILLRKRIGDKVKKGSDICRIYTNREVDKEIIDYIEGCFLY